MLERLRSTGVIVALTMLLALSASADPECLMASEPAVCEARESQSSDENRAALDRASEAPYEWTSSTRIGSGEGVQPTSLDPYRGMRAMAHPFKQLVFWAQGQGFHLSRRSALYDIQGGAALALYEDVRLTASYRMSGVDFGYDSDTEGADLEPSIQATFIGMAFDF